MLSGKKTDLYSLYPSRTATRVAAWALSSCSVLLDDRSFGMFMLLAGPARGCKPEQEARLLQVLAQLLVNNRLPTPHFLTSVSVGGGESTSGCQIDCIVKGTRFRVWPSPGSSGFLVCEMCKVVCVLQSHPKVLNSPMYGRFSTTAFSNSLSQTPAVLLTAGFPRQRSGQDQMQD